MQVAKDAYIPDLTYVNYRPALGPIEKVRTEKRRETRSRGLTVMIARTVFCNY